MASVAERTPNERQTMIFSRPEQAQGFTERVAEQLERQQMEGVHRRREVVAGAVAQEFASHGEAVELIRTPWEHTAQEHAEVQHLVDVAFAKDLPAALRLARQSPHYPRNLDLLHDLLTGQMYALVQQSALHQQPVLPWVAAVIIVLALLGLTWLLVI